ncbi:carboxylating nicotinate-nucleotide diphosphorylase [Pelagicoccus sp. SDUM812003]|uniref:carboxylating nicotinate-nucleotide diphosphorylase n=1 Tax=Pelagicoccus sp. SDUM812003 TaxID=3041267 RepID=UPI00280CD024|nr:carboxylating nicotinate-nucleotide diphosphorylase [Pelagicoccus sp. SDUM812003]MDQ8204813.1 carboxylating nicotinate-nucleotide diphosphorylase [Pelagicoccus sp. SDUM812003]
MTGSPRKRPDLCCQRITWQDIDLTPVQALVQLAKEEDLEGGGLRSGTKTPGDHSAALLPADQKAKAYLRARKELVVCGLPLAREVLAAYHPGLSLAPDCQDGDFLRPGQSIASISGPVRALLSAERPLLNFLQMLSGVSTETRRYVAALGETSTRLLDTRKTTPGYRILEKYAVACGGAWNHRIGLFDRVMLKDNHIAAFGPEPKAATVEAVRRSRQKHPKMLVEMEVDALEQIEYALAAEVDVIMLDNFADEELHEAIKLIGDRACTEASGGITIERLPRIAGIGLDFISTGALVHQSSWIDIGLDWE